MPDVNLEIAPQAELAPKVPVRLGDMRAPRYGRTLEDLTPGAIFHHPRGLTITQDLIQLFASDFFECNPLYRNVEHAKKKSNGKGIWSSLVLSLRFHWLF